jgi:streptogramin lyase
MSLRAKKIIPAFIFALLTACGGGGSDSTVGSATQSTMSDRSGTSSSGGGTPDSSSNSPTETVPNASVDETARFNVPSDIASDSAGNLYVMDRGNQAIRRIASMGDVSTVSGSYDARARLAMDAAGNLFVLEGTNVSRGASDGSKTLVTSYPAQPGSYTPTRIALDAQGRLYVLLRYRNLFRVDRIDPNGSSGTVYSFGTYGEITDFASDAQGNLAIGSISPTLTSSSITRVPHTAQPSDQSSPEVVTQSVHLNPYGKMAFDAAGNLYIADAKYTLVNSTTPAFYEVSGMRVIRVGSDGAVTTILNGFPDGSNGTRQTSSTVNTIGITVGRNGNVFLTDPFDNAVYRLSDSGQATLIAGKPGESGNSD